MYADVIMEINVFKNKTFTYKIPSNIKVEIGSRVHIPFGSKKVNGIVLNIKDDYKDNIQLKEIIGLIDDKPILNKEQINLIKFLRDNYLCTYLDAYKVMMPSQLKLSKNINNIKTEKKYYIKNIKEVNTKAEQNILNLFKDKDYLKPSEISNKKALKILLEKDILFIKEEEKYRLNNNFEIIEKIKLTKEQQKIYEEINYSKDSIFLLRGVTGSGKTEIYMDLIEDVLKENKEVIVLVPEISITTQLVSRFKGRFQDKVALFHSGLSAGERYDEWRKIKRKEVSIVVGARSAIFSPFTNIGLIIMDEENDESYKQENNPRYNTIDVAIERIKYNNAKLLLGSATPSLESYARAKVNRYHLLELETRVNNKKLPKVEIIDMKTEMKKGNSIISSVSKNYILDRLNKKEQIMILINRRGYSNYVICSECGEVIKCPNCDISLTYHKNNNSLKCHYCNFQINMPNNCKKCNSKYLSLKGKGTEKIEEVLHSIFKDIRVIRMDSDTTSKKSSHEKIIKDFNDYKYDVLLGTQMIAKGLDFANVTLVVVIDADSSLYISDYRSSERTFSLLTQVSGRAGRHDKEGNIVIQTFNPNHYAIKLVENHDYVNFYNNEITIRKRLYYPPFCFIVAIRILSNDFEKGSREINKINNILKSKLDEKNKILGPTIFPKINNIYGFQTIIKYKNKEPIMKVLEEIDLHYINSEVKLEIDFNPNRL
ncbi:MAG: primosomal protein N' [Bacilli bacterium]|nr:primosomal protein N' [Bacilli bacterium]